MPAMLAQLSAAAQSIGPVHTTTKSADLDGVDEYINLGAVFTGTASGDPFTIACWIKADTVTGNDFVVGVTGAGGGLPLIQITTSRFFVYNEWGYRRSAATVSNGTWYHILFTSSGSGAAPTLYINGAASAGTTSASAIARNAALNWVIGRADTYYYDGKVCELALWHEVLDAGEIAAVYNSGARHDLRDLATPPASYLPIVESDDLTNGTGEVQAFISAYTGTPVNTESGDLVTDSP